MRRPLVPAGAYKHTAPGPEPAARLVPPDRFAPDNLPRPDEQQYLAPWDADDRTGSRRTRA